MISVVRTGCNQYAIQTGNTGTTYEITIANINGGLSQSYTVTDNANVVINFSIDGVYTFTASNALLFLNNCTDISIAEGGVDNEYVGYAIPFQYLAPQYTGYVIYISIVVSTPSGPVTYSFSYTIQNTDTSTSILSQNIVDYINGLDISGVTALFTSGYIQINVPHTITNTRAAICGSIFTKLLWSTCALWKCIQRLITKIFCCKRNKCEEHTKDMQKERNELNRIMLLYSQFSMMNDDERWDYLPLNLNTNIQNDLFDKLNVITARCGHCCKDYRRKHHNGYEDNDNGCNECNPQPVTDWCQKLPTEAISITGPAIPISS